MTARGLSWAEAPWVCHDFLKLQVRGRSAAGCRLRARALCSPAFSSGPMSLMARPASMAAGGAVPFE